MRNILDYGPGRKTVRAMVRLSWPVIVAGKKFSRTPVLRHLINPFFTHSCNQVTAIPIQCRIEIPDTVVMPLELVERLVAGLSDVFIMNECICRVQKNCRDFPRDIGCMALGPAISRIHPSHGGRATREEAVAHVRRAADAGLIANLAHVWVDPVAFGLTRFDRLMFFCFCDDCCCMYRTHMKSRGPNLDRAYMSLPGISVDIDPEICTGCGICLEHCFVAAMSVRDGVAVPGPDCKGCGRCVQICPHGAAALRIEEEESVYQGLLDRIRQAADIWSTC